MDARTITGTPNLGSPRPEQDRPPQQDLLARLEQIDGGVAVAAMLAACDVAVLLDHDGIVLMAHAGAGDIASADIAGWVGRPLADTVSSDGRAKIEQMLQGLESRRWRQVNHPADGGELPLRWLALPLPGGQWLAIARDLRAAAALQQRVVRTQQAMERDALRLRQLEARYRLVFDATADPLMVIDVASRRVVEANPAARRATGLGAALEGERLTSLIHPLDQDLAGGLIMAVTAAESQQPVQVRLAGGTAWQLAATLFRQERDTRLLVRLRSLEADAGAPAAPTESPLAGAMERMPDAFVLTDDNFDIIAANGAFIDLLGLPSRDAVGGQPLSRWLGRAGGDLGLLTTTLREHGAVRGFATALHGDDGVARPVEVSAVTSGDAVAGAVNHGFSIRLQDALAKPAAPALGAATMHRSVEQLTELVGRVSLKDIVRESTDLIERLCIEAALGQTDDNRASAADLLGLSRQSLYSKLHRHGLGNLDSGHPPENASD